MSEPLDELYFKWLYDKVAKSELKSPVRTYWFLLRHLFRKEFVWFIPNDDNRVEDGRALRYEFLNDRGIDADEDWLGLGCSMLEMLIGLARRLDFDSERSVPRWFWELMDNMRISEFNDKFWVSSIKAEEVIDYVLDKVIWRTYKASGEGGLFPLKSPREDQREVELWYQMNAYLLEPA